MMKETCHHQMKQGCKVINDSIGTCFGKKRNDKEYRKEELIEGEAEILISGDGVEGKKASPWEYLWDGISILATWWDQCWNGKTYDEVDYREELLGDDPEARVSEHRKASMSVDQRGALDSIHVYAKLLIGVRYDSEKEMLLLKIISAESLPRRPDNTAPNTFVEARVGSCGEPARTKQINSTTNPKFDESLQLKATLQDRRERKLEVKICDSTKCNVTLEQQEIILGIIRVRFDCIDLSKLEHDFFYIPIPDKSNEGRQDPGRSSLINCKISRNAAMIYASHNDGFKLNAEEDLVEVDEDSREEDRGRLVAEVVDIVHCIKCLQNMDSNNLKALELSDLEEKVQEKTEEVNKLELFIERFGSELRSREECTSGAVRIGLQYKRIEMKMMLEVFSAVELATPGSVCNPYVEVTITRGSKNRRKETTTKISEIKMNSLNPDWVGAVKEETNVEKQELESMSVVVSVFNYNTIRKNVLLGKVRLGKGHLHDQGHWEEMMDAREAVTKWHCLSKS